MFVGRVPFSVAQPLVNAVLAIAFDSAAIDVAFWMVELIHFTHVIHSQALSLPLSLYQSIRSVRYHRILCNFSLWHIIRLWPILSVCSIQN